MTSCVIWESCSILMNDFNPYVDKTYANTTIKYTYGDKKDIL